MRTVKETAIARGLSLKPSIILADEPTGNLDTTTSKEVLKLLDTVVKKNGNYIYYNNTLVYIRLFSFRSIV